MILKEVLILGFLFGAKEEPKRKKMTTTEYEFLYFLNDFRANLYNYFFTTNLMRKRLGVIVLGAIVILFIIVIVLYYQVPRVKEVIDVNAALVTLLGLLGTLLGILIAIFLWLYPSQNEKEKTEEKTTEEIDEETIKEKITTILSPISGLCIGRDTELRKLEEDLTHKNILLIKGIAGIGKTTLGLKFRDIVKEKGYQTFWHQFDSQSYERLLIELSDYLKVRGSMSAVQLKDQGIPPEERLRRAVNELCTYQTVLFLDDFQVFDNDSDFKIFKDYLRNSCIIIMSRVQPKFLSEEYESLQYLDKDSSVDLLKTLKVEGSLTVLEKIYEKTKGHPWSLVCFKRLSRVLPVKNLLDELPDFSKEQEEYISGQCWQHLHENERDFLMRASVFTKPLDFDALKVCSKTGLSDVLISLAESFYILKRGENYYIHDIMKDFSSLKLKENPELYAEAHRRAAAYYKRRLSAEHVLLMYYHLKEAEDYREAVKSVVYNIKYFWREGYWKDVREVLEESLDFVKDEKIIGDIYGDLGSIVDDLGEWDTAVQYYEKSLEIKEKMGDIHGMAMTYGNLGLVYYSKGEWDTAVEYYEKSLEISEKIGDIHGMGTTYGNLGSVYYSKGEWDTAVKYYEKSLEIFEEIKDIYGMAQTYNNLGLVYADKGEWDTAVEYYEKSLEISEKIGDIHGMASTYNNLGSVYYSKGEWDTAVEYYKKSLEISEKIGDIHGMGTTYGNLGSVYADKGEWDTAVKYYEKSLEISEKIGDIHGMGTTYGNLGSVYVKKGEWDTAIQYYEKSLEIKEKIGDIHEMAMTWGNLAEAYCGKDDIDTALDYCNNSFEILEKPGDRINLADVHRTYGIIFRKRKELQKSKEELGKSIKIYQELSVIYELAKTFYELAVTLLEIGDTTNAREYFIKALNIFKELNVNHHIKKVEDQLNHVV